MTAKTPAKETDALLHDLRHLIEETRSSVATTVNASLTMLYWRVGKRINEEILKGDRAEYGEKIVHALSAQLQQEYGQGFTRRNLFNMIRFCTGFSSRGNCLRTAYTIKLDAFPDAHRHRRPPEKRLLYGNVPA